MTLIDCVVENCGLLAKIDMLQRSMMRWELSFDIGASPSCSGQILVIDDILGINPDFTPKFVKKYGNIANDIKKAVSSFKGEVESGSFPGSKNLLS